MKHHPSTQAASFTVPGHWSPEQALAVFEGLQVVREALWAVYGQQAQQAWRSRLVHHSGPPDFDPDLPF